MNTAASAKRTREQENSVEDSQQSAPSSPITAKALRLTRPETAPLFCSLPPTCNPPHNEPTAIASVSELETHYAKYHAHVCMEKGCAAVFPNARLLELHQTECHDPIVLLRKERGEKVFACHLESCTRKFMDPKKRRLHLIQAHNFPKEYFFAVTNKGVGGLLKKWGEGASMLRGTWRTRDSQAGRNGNEDRGVESGEDADDDDDSLDEEMSAGTVKNVSNNVKPPSNRPGQGANGNKKAIDAHPAPKSSSSTKATDLPDVGLGDLANSMGSLSLVPPSIRFGRGGKSARVARESHTDFKGGKLEQKSRHCFPTDATRHDSILPMDARADRQLPDNDVSINIDGALEALKSEAPPSISARTVSATSSTGDVPASGRRARGGRGRGRGPGRVHGRGRG